jgi:hypothetical protein
LPMCWPDCSRNSDGGEAWMELTKPLTGQNSGHLFELDQSIKQRLSHANH